MKTKIVTFITAVLALLAIAAQAQQLPDKVADAASASATAFNNKIIELFTERMDELAKLQEAAKESRNSAVVLDCTKKLEELNKLIQGLQMSVTPSNISTNPQNGWWIGRWEMYYPTLKRSRLYTITADTATLLASKEASVGTTGKVVITGPATVVFIIDGQTIEMRKSQFKHWKNPTQTGKPDYEGLVHSSK